MGGKMSRNKGAEWRTLAWLPDYEVSSEGDLRRCVDGVTRKAGFVLKGSVNRGYRRFKVSLNGMKFSVLAHRLVCEAWHGPNPIERPLVAHYDGNPLNNHYSNLRWASCQENLDDRKRHGTEMRGVANGRAKLTEIEVASIRQKYRGEYGDVARLAREYGLSHSAMWSICKGEHWSHV